MKIIAFAMQKGGVGKTTTAVNIAVNLQAHGNRVLLVDLDPQANATQGLGIDPNTLTYSIYEVLLNPAHGTEFATVQTASGVAVVPSTLALSAAEVALSGSIGRELLLREALAATKTPYDYVLIDLPPSLGLFTINGLVAAHSIIMPVQAQAYCLKALPGLEETITLVRKLNQPLAIGGVVVTLTDRTNLSKVAEDQVRQRYGELVFNTLIPRTVKLAEAPAAGEAISTYAPGTTGDDAYQALTREIEERYGEKQVA
jgi:chromosome partitioning protein